MIEKYHFNPFRGRSPWWIYTGLFFALLQLTCGKSSDNAAVSPLPQACRQLVVVTTSSWETSSAVLYRFERRNQKSEWQMTGNPIEAIVGKKGLGWGRGLHPSEENGDPLKREGDGKSPAGVFNLTYVFGFASPEEMDTLKMPYVHINEMVECVDDPHSQYYNSIVNRQKIEEVDWESSERMWRARLWYELGVFVAHNVKPANSGAGSCIFLHYWANPQDSTSGCTAMDRSHMKEIVYWLDEQKIPVLVQVPGEFYNAVKSGWKLPALDRPDNETGSHKKMRTDPAVFEKSDVQNDVREFRAVGNEPGWILTLKKGGQIFLQTNYGKETYQFKTPRPEQDKNSNQTIYRLQEQDVQLTIIIEQEECQDSMSGELHEAKVMVLLNDIQLKGCGEYLN